MRSLYGWGLPTFTNVCEEAVSVNCALTARCDAKP
jgi:hypothetical protein